MSEKHISAGEIIFREGDVPDVAYSMVSGNVELSYRSHDGEVKLGTLAQGAVFGELAIFDRTELRNNTATAVTDSIITPITPEAFDDALATCPAIIQLFIRAAFEKFIPVKTRSQTTLHPMSRADINKITLLSNDEALKSHIRTIILTPETLPFRIGGYPEGGEKKRKDNIQLAIPSHNPPLVISRQHCEIAIENDVIGITDLGSRFGTTVNGRAIGRGRGMYFLPLQKGENTLLLGSPEHNYTLGVICE